MRHSIYWMVLQILIGIWLMVSPFALGYREATSLLVSNVVFGAVVLILGAAALYSEKTSPGIEHAAKKAA